MKNPTSYQPPKAARLKDAQGAAGINSPVAVCAPTGNAAVGCPSGQQATTGCLAGKSAKECATGSSAF